MLQEEVIAKVASRAKELSTHSWEIGTAAETLLELKNPQLSVFRKQQFPIGEVPCEKNSYCESLQYARPHIRTDGSKTLCEDSTGVADPASLGVSAVLLGQHQPEYLDAARRQVRYLFEEAPRYGKMAISHRSDVAEAWADFVYMVPPFLAFYGVSANDTTILEKAVEQCEAYHKILAKGNEDVDRGLWHHIAGPNHPDPGYWATGNGWVAAGLTRVLATLMRWAPTQKLDFEGIETLKKMIRELIDSVIATDLHISEEELLPNYLYAVNDEPWFGDVAGTALLTSVVYRMMILDREHFQDVNRNYTAWANRKSKAVFRCVDTENGIAKPAVNSLKHAQREPLMTGNPEAQSFVVLLWAAMRDYQSEAG